MNDSTMQAAVGAVRPFAGNILRATCAGGRPRQTLSQPQNGIATLRFSARDRRVVRRGGHDLDVQAIEASVCTHPDVGAAAVVARPDLYAGELPVLHVEFRAGGYQSRKGLLLFLSDRLQEKRAWPVDVRISLGLPRLPDTAAVYRPALQLWEAERCVREVARATAMGLSAITINPISGDHAVAKIDVVSGDVKLFRRALERYSISMELD